MSDLDHPDLAEQRILGRETLHEGRKFSLERVRVHAGREGDSGWREVVRHSGAVSVVPVLEGRKGGEARVVLIRNERFTVGEALWELPAGGIDAGEKPEKCARRELREETGYKAKSLRLLGSFYTTPGMTDEMMHMYVATGLERGKQRLEADERITVEVVSASRALDMAWNGTIRDGKSIAGLAMAWRAGAFGDDVAWGPAL